MATVSFKDATRVYPGADHPAVDKLNLEIGDGEFMVLVGPSGCGKSTSLRMLAGLEEVNAGAIRIGDRNVTDLPPKDRDIAMVFQNYALYPHMTVGDNMGFALKMAGVPKAERDARVSEMLALIKLEQLGDRYPYQLAGGQQQRVALARALAPRPNLLLLDEPLSALDAKVRVALRDDIRAIQRELGITAIFVTHDQEEALSISDRVVVMHQGRADQIGTPAEIYNRPATRFVAGFVGQLNMFDAVLREDAALEFAGQRFAPAARRVLSPDGTPTGPVTVALRPEALSLTPRREGDAAIEGRVINYDFLGSVVRVRVEVAGQPVSIDMFNSPDAELPRPGSTAPLYFSAEEMLVLPK